MVARWREKKMQEQQPRRMPRRQRQQGVQFRRWSGARRYKNIKVKRTLKRWEGAAKVGRQGKKARRNEF
jgi:hypothetical protein